MGHAIRSGSGRWLAEADDSVSQLQGSWMPEESQIKSYKHQDNANIHYQPFPEPVSEEHEIYTDYHRCHRRDVKYDSYLSAHFSEFTSRHTPLLKQVPPPFALRVVWVLDFHPRSFVRCIEAIFPLGDDTLQVGIANRPEEARSVAIDLVGVKHPEPADPRSTEKALPFD